MPPAAIDAPAGLVTLTERLMADLHTVGLLLRSGYPLEGALLGRMSASATAILDEIELAAASLGDLPADTGDDVRQQVAEAVSAVRLFERVLEYRL